MTHLNDDQLLLLSYGELDDAEQHEAHLAACEVCRERLERLDRSRAALELAGQARVRRTRAGRWIAALGLAAAAVVATLLLIPGRGAPAERRWAPPQEWSVTAGYIAGGTSVVEIDAQLTRLEQERYYGLPD